MTHNNMTEFFDVIRPAFKKGDVVAAHGAFKKPDYDKSLLIKKVIFNDLATIIFWQDGTKTVVKTQNGEVFDPEKGMAMAIAKKAMGNQGNYFNTIKEHVKDYEPKPVKKEERHWHIWWEDLDDGRRWRHEKEYKRKGDATRVAKQISFKTGQSFIVSKDCPWD